MTARKKESKIVKGRAAKFYHLTPDPEGCHKSKVDHYLDKLAKGEYSPT